MSAGCVLPDFVRTSSEPSGGLLEAGHRVTQREADAVLFQVALDEAGAFRVERGHDLVEHLDQRHFEPAVDQVFRHLKADVSPADYHRALRLVQRESRGRMLPGQIARTPFDPLPDVPRIRHGPHRKDPREIDSGQGRTDRSRPGREHELVVFLGGYLAGDVILEFHGFFLGRDADRLAVRPHIDRKLPRNVCSVATRRLDSFSITPPIW